MEIFTLLAQITVAASVAFVWIFRFDNIIKEFNEFGLSALIRSFVGAAKISTATLLVVSIWYGELLMLSSVIMGFFMLSAQYFHFKVSNPFIKRLPSLVLFLLCLYMALTTSNLL
jgi:hypothetical protein